MKAQGYNRSRIYSFYELSEEQQGQAVEELGGAAEGETFVIYKNKGGDQLLALSNFTRTDGGRYHGYFGTSYYSGYGIIINRTGEECTVIYLIG